VAAVPGHLAGAFPFAAVANSLDGLWAQLRDSAISLQHWAAEPLEVLQELEEPAEVPCFWLSVRPALLASQIGFCQMGPEALA